MHEYMCVQKKKPGEFGAWCTGVEQAKVQWLRENPEE